jgi:Flp pilus assembly protein TadB
MCVIGECSLLFWQSFLIIILVIYLTGHLVLAVFALDIGLLFPITILETTSEVEGAGKRKRTNQQLIQMLD